MVTSTVALFAHAVAVNRLLSSFLSRLRAAGIWGSKTTAFCIATLLLNVSNVAHALPAYEFSTSSSSLFGTDTVVSGTFLYNAAASATATPPNAPTIYGGNLSNLTGVAAGNVFTDNQGTTVVGNDTFPATPVNVDFLQLLADPPQNVAGPRNLVGFTINNFTLFNVRMFWIEGEPGIPDFLNDQDLPAVLPALQGRLALDFVPVGNPSGPLTTVFFDGLTVTQVPEPGMVALLGIGLLPIAFAYRRPRELRRRGLLGIRAGNALQVPRAVKNDQEPPLGRIV